MLRFIGTQTEWRGELIEGVRHSRNIETLWGEEQLAEIGLERYKPEPPAPVDPLTIPLDRHELRMGLLALGVKQQDILEEISKIEDDEEREEALINWEDAKNNQYHFHHDLVLRLMTGLGMDKKQAKAQWIKMVESR